MNQKNRFLIYPSSFIPHPSSLFMWRRRKEKRQLDDKASVASAPSPSAQPRFLAPEVLASISSLELLARTVVEGFLTGLHRSPFTGFSNEFAEYRQYQPGDDLRYLDWRLLGRTDRFFIKKFRADTNTQCHILIDTSASMRYATGAVTKLQYAQFLAAALSYLFSRQQDAVGLVAFNEQVRTHIPALNRSGQMRTIFGHLAQLEAGGETNLAKILHEVAERMTRRGIIVLISDMYAEPASLTPALQHLRFNGNDVIVFHVLDKNEIEFNFEDDTVLLEDAETEEQMPVLPDVFAKGYRERMHKHIEDLRATITANRIDYELITTDQPLDYALFSFLSKRAKR